MIGLVSYMGHNFEVLEHLLIELVFISFDKFNLPFSALRNGRVGPAIVVVRALQERSLALRELNLKVMMGNVSACIETLTEVLKSTYDEIVSQWMEDRKSSLGKEKSFQQLFYLAMRARGNKDWFRPDGGETFFQPSEMIFRSIICSSF